MQKYLSNILIAFLVLPLFGTAQEMLIPMEGNPVLKTSEALKMRQLWQNKSRDNDTLALPFFDDFAKLQIYPDADKWMDNDAYISSGVAADAISIGVASLDIADSIGDIYNLPTTSSEPAEELTSKPLDLNLDPADSVYLSFFYQAGGNGMPPEEYDSLQVQFCTPDTIWHTVWNMPGGETDTAFKQVLIPITDEYLLKKGFQFRFRNFGSVGELIEPSRVTNLDVWNLDYVYLDSARSFADTIPEDVAFIQGFSALLKGYENVPWTHFLTDPEGLTGDTLLYVYKNNGVDTQNINRQVYIRDLWGGGDPYEIADDNENIYPFNTLYYKRPVGYVFESDTEDSARFEIKGYIKTDTVAARQRYRWNDTIYYYHEFRNFYAYDDGIPEKGYGINGQGTSSAALAYRFDCLKTDTLRGVNMYFNRVLNNENQNYFYLCVWEDNNGEPGDTLIRQVGVRPEHADSMYQYVYYPLDSAIQVSGTFYVGWIKTTDDMLNIGFDENRNASDKIFFNVSGTWQNTMYAGALMIRPVLDDTPVSGVSQEPLKYRRAEIYPNPAREYFNIHSQEDIYEYCLYNSSGQMMHRGNDTRVSTAAYREGMYILLIRYKNGQSEAKKLMIIH